MYQLHNSVSLVLRRHVQPVVAIRHNHLALISSLPRGIGFQMIERVRPGQQLLHVLNGSGEVEVGLGRAAAVVCRAAGPGLILCLEPRLHAVLPALSGQLCSDRRVPGRVRVVAVEQSL